MTSTTPTRTNCTTPSSGRVSAQARSARSARSPLRAADLADATPASRDRTLDALRVLSIALVVFGHWMMAGVSFGPHGFTATNTLATLAWLQPLTWILQVMPLFFIVGGAANAASLARRPPYGDWLRSRLARLVRPTAVLVAVWNGLIIVGAMLGVPPSVVRLVSTLASRPLWFLAVYVAVVAVAPAMLCAHRRAPWITLVGLGVGAAAGDLLRFGAGISTVGWLNFGFVWLFAHQLGFFWRRGGAAAIPTSKVASKLVGGAVAALAGIMALVWIGPYPVSMIGMPGEKISNMNPPTLALVLVAIVQFCIVVASRPALERLCARRRVWRSVVAANSVVMTVFCWHLTALMLWAVVALSAGFWQPAIGSAEWWILRPIWLAGAVLPLVGLVAAFRVAELPRPVVGAAFGGAPGMALAAAGLGGALCVFAISGFWPTPWTALATFAVAVGVVTVPARRHEDSQAPSPLQ